MAHEKQQHANTQCQINDWAAEYRLIYECKLIGVPKYIHSRFPNTTTNEYPRSCMSLPVLAAPTLSEHQWAPSSMKELTKIADGSVAIEQKVGNNWGSGRYVDP
jgi:hypothetical protein